MELVKDDHLLINDIINYAFTSNPQHNMVEIIVRPECNQQCEYCYIKQQGKKLYPTHYPKETIIKNISKLIDYFIEQDYLISTLELFAGDMFYDDLFFDIMPDIIRYYQYINTNHPDFIENHHLGDEINFTEPVIIVPCNMTFCEYPDKKAKVRKIHKDLHELGVKLNFSYSTDGIYSTDVREKKELKEEYFDNILAFCSELDWGLHPMISYEGIDNAIENYEWFKRKFQQFKINHGSTIPMYLEVRNPGWNAEQLQKYKEFVLYLLDDIFHNFYQSSIPDFCETYFKLFHKNETNVKYSMSGDPPGIGRFPIITTKHLPCSLGSFSLIVYAGNLSIVPCHRLAYPEYQGAKFITNEEGKLEIEATPFMNSYLSMYYYNNTLSSNCQLCDYKHVCLKGCPGAQYEYFADATMQIPSVCDLFKVKYQTLLEYYHSIGLFHYLFQNEPEYPANIIFQDLLVKNGYLEYQIYKDLGDLTNVE